MAVLEISKENFDSEVINSSHVTVVDFYATWCGPCRMLSPILEELSNEKENVKFVSVDVDEAGELAEKYGVQSIPCVVIFKDGKEYTRSIGFRPKEDFENLLGEF